MKGSRRPPNRDVVSFTQTPPVNGPTLAQTNDCKQGSPGYRLGSGDKIEGVILGVGGFLGVGKKEIGVRLGALKIGKADGKIAITFPAATKEMLAAVGTYERPGGAPAKK